MQSFRFSMFNLLQEKKSPIIKELIFYLLAFSSC